MCPIWIDRQNVIESRVTDLVDDLPHFLLLLLTLQKFYDARWGYFAESPGSGKKIDLIGNHIPEMVCHLDPDFLYSPTKTIRGFLGLSTVCV